jgi:uncharacterized membrane protein YbaN (DUF454 family)
VKLARIALVVIGLMTLVMGILGATTVMYGVVDPMWHAVFKIIIGLIAVGIGLVEKSWELGMSRFFLFCLVD